MTTKRAATYVLALFVAIGIFWAFVGARLSPEHPVRTMIVVGGSIVAAGVVLVGAALAVKIHRLKVRRRASNLAARTGT